MSRYGAEEETFWVELLYRGRPGGEKNPEAGFPEKMANTNLTPAAVFASKNGS